MSVHAAHSLARAIGKLAEGDVETFHLGACHALVIESILLAFGIAMLVVGLWNWFRPTIATWRQRHAPRGPRPSPWLVRACLDFGIKPCPGETHDQLRARFMSFLERGRR